jgi:hypothetical protein
MLKQDIDYEELTELYIKKEFLSKELEELLELWLSLES